MPTAEESPATVVGTGPGAPLPVLRERALAVLTDPALAHLVDLVGYVADGHVYAANAAGAARAPRGGGPAELLWGRDPLASADALRYTPLTAELANHSPPNAEHAYPDGWRRLAAAFADAERAPDLAVVHTGRHHWPERGGHLGEHGSLNVVQSRAPLLLAGPGALERGRLAAAARVVDVGPTLAWLAGVPLAALAGLDGAALTDLAAPAGGPVIGLLWDGTNANSLLALAAAGELPAVAWLLERGCALVGGAVAEFPSVTLANHTSALTGLSAGRHGIVNNSFFDRRTLRTVHANAGSTWHLATELLRPGVRTVFELVDAPTACVNEPIDRGAGYSTFALVRAAGAGGASGMTSALPAPDAHTSAARLANRAYAFASQLDSLALEQVLGLFADADVGSVPRLTWWNSTLPDTGHHEGGPHTPMAHDALRDSDRRLGALLDRLDGLGLLDAVTFLLTADHGSEGADVGCVGDWDAALAAEGIPFRDEAYGFVYLGEQAAAAPR